MNYAAVRSRYLGTATSTATPSQLLVMLYDRLLLDLSRAESAQLSGDRAAAGTALTHAQDIVGELAASLDVDAWDGANALLSLYTYLLTELVQANVTGDADRTAACRSLVAPLRDAWQEAAAAAAPPVPTQRPRAASGEHTVGGELGVG